MSRIFNLSLLTETQQDANPGTNEASDKDEVGKLDLGLFWDFALLEE